MVACGARWPRVSAEQGEGCMSVAPTVLAVALEAFGGRGGMAQYNRYLGFCDRVERARSGLLRTIVQIGPS